MAGEGNVALASIPTYATGDTIESSWANTLRDNALLLDARTGGDPGAAGRVLVSSGALGAGWLAPGSNGQLLQIVGGVPAYGQVGAAGIAAGAVGSAQLGSGAAVGNLGYTPVNKAGDSGIGNLILVGVITLGGNIAYLNSGTTRYIQYDAANDRYILGGTVDLVRLDGAKFWNAANDGAGTGLDADLVDGIQAAAFARLSGASFTGDVTTSGVMRIDNQVLYLNAGATRYLQYDSVNDRYIFGGAQALIDASGGLYWKSTNDGSGSGLDAGLLEGHPASFFQVAGVSGPLPQIQFQPNSAVLVFPTSYSLVNGCTVTIQATGTWVIMVVAHATLASADGQTTMRLHVNGSPAGIEPTFGDAETGRRSASILYSASFTGGDSVALRAKKASGLGASQIDTAAIVAFRTA
jgi:hypothetical protein